MCYNWYSRIITDYMNIILMISSKWRRLYYFHICCLSVLLTTAWQKLERICIIFPRWRLENLRLSTPVRKQKIMNRSSWNCRKNSNMPQETIWNIWGIFRTPNQIENVFYFYGAFVYVRMLRKRRLDTTQGFIWKLFGKLVRFRGGRGSMTNYRQCFIHLKWSAV